MPTAGSTRQALTKTIATNINALDFTYDAAAPATTVVTISIDTQARSMFGKTFTVSNNEKALLRNK